MFGVDQFQEVCKELLWGLQCDCFFPAGDKIINIISRKNTSNFE